MTLPRSVVPGSTYLITRRTTQRQFLLRPDPKTVSVFEYCLAEAAEHVGLIVHAWLTMSNHYHVVATDPHGRLPAFLHRLNVLLSKSLNVRWGRWENVWTTEPACATRLVESSDVLDKIVYALANPVADHLVERASDWPGSSSWFFVDGRRKVVRRPVGFFRDNGSMPEEVILEATQPECVADRASWAEQIREGVRKVEGAAHEERRRTGVRVLGARAARRVSAFSSPTTQAPRRNLRPQIACRSAERRDRELVALRRFQFAYAEARRRYAAGEREVPFPLGTYHMRSFGVVVLQAPA